MIDSDGKGYYQYLTATFISHNLSSQQSDERYIFKTERGAVNKYFAGTAFAMLPFFGAGYISAAIAHKPLNGYSPPFQRAISFAGLCYLCLGLFFLAKLLMLYGTDLRTTLILIVAITFGTNLLMYAVYHPSFSHVYSFCFVAMFLYFSKLYFTDQRLKHISLVAFAFGMIVLIRPTNGLIILTIPFLAGNYQTLKSSIAGILNIRALYPILIFLSVVAIQPILWKVQTGEFFVKSYVNEGFYFSQPEILNVLFSFRKGFFLYTPLALLSLVGLYVVGRKSKFQLYSLLLFFILLIYITASWWNWYYGPSFGQRPFIEFYPLFALLLSFLITFFKREHDQKIFLGVIALFVSLNLLQSFQYVKNIISPWNMNYQKYKYTFLRTSPKYYACLGGSNDITPYPREKVLLRNVFNDYEHQYINWTHSKLIDTGNEHKMAADFRQKEFNTACDIIADSALTKYRLLYAQIRLDRNEPVPSGKSGPLVGIVMSNSKKKNYHYQTFGINEIPNKTANQWQTFTYSVELPRVKKAGDVIRFYIWNKNKQELLIDNFRVVLYGIE
ncbi:MAG: hypothetical protein K0Q95_1153 [Bacteroidota bacterium]|nr:hypothetical protein [Bacteroidota bacterium]